MVKKGKKVSKYIITIIAIIVIAIVVGGLYKAGLIKFTPLDTEEENLVATVNQEKITQEQLDKQYELFFILLAYPESAKQQINKTVYLNQMVVEELMLQEAEKEGISPLLVSSEELKSSLDVYLNTNQITIQQLAENLVSKGLTTDDLQNYFKKQIAINNFLNKTLLDKIRVTDDEVKDFYEQNSASFIAEEGQIRARRILVETEEEAEEVIAKLRDGEDFAQLAREYSLDTASVARGGNLGFFSKDMMVEEFSEAAFELTVNKISKPVQTQFGWHVIQRQSDKILFEETYDELSSYLYQQKQRTALQTYLEQIKAQAEIEILI